jgi:N-acylneuraminate cytidylyltransferase
MKNPLEKKLREMKIYAGIFARGGSKGVKRKNIRTLNERPLISYSIHSALQNKFIDYLFVSTEDKEIAKISESLGANIPFIRPEELASDNAAMWPTYKHAMEFFKERNDLPDILIDLPCTSPMRNDKDINDCLSKIIEDEFDAVITITHAKRHPMFNMITIDDDEFARLMSSPKDDIKRRQDTPSAYDITTVAYAFKTEYILKSNSLFEGKVGAIIVPEDRALDIDSEFDFKIAKLLMEFDEPKKK